MLRAIERRLSGRSGREITALVLKNIAYGVQQLRPAAAVQRRRDDAFDRRWGTETSRLANLSSLQVNPARARHGVRYQPSTGDALERAVADLGLKPEAYSLVDYGSGKGRVVMIAARMGFRRVIGVEFSPELCEIAERNVQHFVERGGAVTAPEIVLGDAGTFEPPGGPLLAYLYNPFGSPVLDEVIARLEQRAAAGDAVTLCYVDPQHLTTFTARSGWEVVKADPDLALLRIRPESSAASE